MPTKHNKWYAALEQIALSGLNLTFSVLIVKQSGLELFGIYSFVFVICQLFSAAMSSFFFGQMQLFISPLTFRKQRAIFVTTCWMCLISLLSLFVLVTIFYMLSDGSSNEIYPTLIIGGTLYASGLAVSELFRQFLYTQGKQRLSLILTSLGCTFSLVLLCSYFLTDSKFLLIQYAYFCLASGLILSVSLNRICLGHFCTEYAAARKNITLVFKEYADQGKIAFAGTVVTWLQNQSITPLLMLTMGPLAVGTYNLARMVFTPVTIINTGLSRNALPQIRKSFINQGTSGLRSMVNAHSKTSMTIAAGYVITVVLAWNVAHSLELINQNQQILPALIATGTVMLLTNYRYWISQHYIAKMQFGILLRKGLIAALIAMLLMVFSGTVLNSIIVAILASALGEIYLIFTLSAGIRHDE